MKRRQLLLLGSASALALMLPLPAVATASLPYPSAAMQNKLESIEYVFRTLADYRFGTLGRSRAFGFPDDMSLIRLHELVERREFGFGGSMDMHERIESWLSVRELLNRRFGEKNIAEHLRWLATAQIYPGRYTCRDMLETGSYNDLRHVTRFMLEKLL